MLIIMMLSILIAAPVALFAALCAINRSHPETTRPAVYGAFLVIAWGWACVLFSAIDALAHDAPLFYPAGVVFGVTCLAVGNALIYLTNRRRCDCVGCPGRRQVRESP